MPYVYEVSGRYICVTRFDDRHIPEKAGFQFSKTASDERPVWHTNRPEVAFRLLTYCEPNLTHKLKDRFKSWLRYKDEGDDVSFKLQYSPRYVPVDYQIRGALHILTNKYAYLWYEAGTGKTFTASMALEYVVVQERKTTVVICPSSLKYTWREEIDDKSHAFLDVLTVNSAKDRLRPADVIIIPDSLIAGFMSTIATYNIGLVIVDEAHRFKNDTSARTKCLTTRRGLDHTFIGRNAARVCLMSGTPMPNYKPVELWPIVNAFAPQAIGFMSKPEYGFKYCESVQAEYGISYGGSENEDELISKLKTSGYMIHQELREGDVPPQADDSIVYLNPTKLGKKTKEAEETLLKSFTLEEILRIARGQSEALDMRVKVKSSLKDVSPKDFIAELRKLSGEQAADEAIPILKDTVRTGGEPVVVFAWHKSVIDKLRTGLADLNPLVINGSTVMKDRQLIVDAFQRGESDVIIINIVAGGLGYTLTRSCKAYFVEFDWVEGNNDQCVRRLRRKGQTRAVEPYYFIFKNSLAHLMLGVLKKKTKNKAAINAALTKEY